MSRRAVIGIVTQTQEAVPGQSPLAWVMGQKYVRALTAAGAVPWIIPLLPDDLDTLRSIYERLDGLFLTGGVDVDPVHYQEERHELCGKTDPPRDAVEMMLVRWAVADYRPVFGVCRGIQILNVALGGTLYQDVGSQYPAPIKHDYIPASAGGYPRDWIAHRVKVCSDSRLSGILGKKEVAVNSMHHQGIRTLAERLVPCAFAPDGLIEGVEEPNGQFLIGVQWHPEELVDTQPEMQRLFGAFVSASRDRVGHP